MYICVFEQTQADLIAHLRETTSRHEGRIQVLEEARNAATAEVSRLQKAVDTAAAELDQTQTSVEIAEKLASDRLESLRQSDEIAEAARAEAVAADSRCTATEKALMAVTKELDEFRDEFKNEQEAHIKVIKHLSNLLHFARVGLHSSIQSCTQVKEGLEKLFAEDKSRVQALSMRLDEETAARKVINHYYYLVISNALYSILLAHESKCVRVLTPNSSLFQCIVTCFVFIIATKGRWNWAR